MIEEDPTAGPIKSLSDLDQSYPSRSTNKRCYFRADATILRNAMRGIGTDEKVIIDLITKRSRHERQLIKRQYTTIYGRDLMEDLKSETSGKFRRTIMALMTPLEHFYAEQLYYAMKGLGTREHTLINILCTLSNQEIQSVKTEYNQHYGHTLEDAIKSDTSGDFRRLLISLCSANRNEDFETGCHWNGRIEAEVLYEAGVGRLGTDESMFNEIMATRSRVQLREIFQQYKELANHDIEEAIKREFSGSIKNALLAIVKSTKNMPKYFAEELQKSMKGIGADHTTLIQILVSRSEIDLASIKGEFLKNYGKSLADWIKYECSGDYRDCLLAIVG